MTIVADPGATRAGNWRSADLAGFLRPSFAGGLNPDVNAA